MSDIQGAAAEQGQSSEFDQEFERLAREEADGQAEAPQSDDRPEAEGQDGPSNSGQEITPPPANEAAPSEPAPKDASDDIWAGAPEPLRKAFEAERAAREKAENASRSNGGRASQAAREAAELRAQLAARAQAPASAAPAEQDKAAPEIDARLKAVVEEYPDIAGPVADALAEMRETVSRLDQAQASHGAREKARQELELAEFVATQEQTLADAHSDWFEVVRSPDFVSWVQSGPQFIKDGIARNGNGIVDGVEAAKIIDLFKGETGQGGAKPDQRRQRQLEGGRTVPARVPPGTSNSSEPTTYDQTWDALEKQDARRQRQMA